jgi:glycosyltransferase involved in cell wall biosynthesis
MHILFVEPYDTGSHGTWMRGYQQYSQHRVDILSLEGQFWQWRLLGGAVTLAEQFLALDETPDLIIASDMLDVTTFRALTHTDIPIVLYFHENQLTYPHGPRQKLRNHYAFINYVSALAADQVYFNSEYHRNVFLKELPKLLNHFPDHKNLHTLDTIAAISSVLPIGLNLVRYDAHRPAQSRNEPPLIMWNHRWEYDKNPEPFLQALLQLANEGVAFEVVLAGENLRQEPTEFLQARAALGERVIHFGYVDSFTDYARLLWQADVIVSTSKQDFFGISVVEAMYCGCYPLLAHRLNYPYLIPEMHRSAHLFKRDASLIHKLRDYLADPQPAPPSLRDFVAQFDWQVQAPHYDATFHTLI